MKNPFLFSILGSGTQQQRPVILLLRIMHFLSTVPQGQAREDGQSSEPSSMLRIDQCIAGFALPVPGGLPPIRSTKFESDGTVACRLVQGFPDFFFSGVLHR
jgi:hypothetical protein